MARYKHIDNPEDRQGSRGSIRKSNRTDHDSAKMATSKGVIQGYGQRFATVEPVFVNLRANKRLNRLTLRGRQKVDTQWKLYCLVHNIEKLAHHGFGQ